MSGADDERASGSNLSNVPPPASGPNLFDEAFEPPLLQGISLDSLGLTRTRLQRGAAQYHPTTGALDLKRVVAGEPDMFRRAALSEAAEVRTVVIEDLPPSGNPDAEAWSRFWVVMSRPLAALQRKGVPVLMRGNRGVLQPAAFVHDIQKRCEQNASEAVASGEDLSDGAVVVDRQSVELLDKIASKYYESLLQARSVDPGRVEDVKLCVLRDLSASAPAARHFELPLPITLNLYGNRTIITHDDVEALLARTEIDCPRLGRSQYDGSFERDVAKGGESARAIEYQLLGATRLMAVRGMQRRLPMSDDVQYCLWTFVEQTPSLECAELISSLSIGHDNPFQNISVLNGLLFSEKPKTRDAQVQIALKLSSGLEFLSREKQKQVDVLDYLRRSAPEMSAPEKAELLENMVSALEAESEFPEMSPAVLSSCRTLCNELLESASEFALASLQTTAWKLNNTYNADDAAAKAWSLALLDKLSRAMQMLPMSFTHEAAAALAGKLYQGCLSSVEHQRSAAEILDRLLDESNPIIDLSKDAIIASLRRAIDDGIIVPELVPEFGSILARATRMEEFGFDGKRGMSFIAP